MHPNRRGRVDGRLFSARDPARRSDRPGARRGSGHTRARMRARTGRCGSRNPGRARRHERAGSPARGHRGRTSRGRRAPAHRGDRKRVALQRPPPALAAGSRRLARSRASSRLRAARSPTALVRPIATSGHVGGGTDADIEAMEGYGVLRAAESAGVPARRGARRLERGRGAGSCALAVRRGVRGAARGDSGPRAGGGGVHELTLRLLALPERHVRVPRGRARARRRGPARAAERCATSRI